MSSSATLNEAITVVEFISVMRAKLNQKQVELDVDPNAGGYNEASAVVAYAKKSIDDIMEVEMGEISNFNMWKIVDELTK